MRSSLSSAGLQDWSGDVLVVGLLQDQPATDLDSRFAGLSAALERQQFKGKPSEQLLINRLEADGPKRLVVLGLGPASSFNLQGVRSAAARARCAFASLIAAHFIPLTFVRSSSGPLLPVLLPQACECSPAATAADNESASSK